MFHKFRVEHVLVVTLTFSERITSTRDAHKRLNSALNNKLRGRYQAYLWVLEPHSNGSIHYHLLLATKADLYRGTDLSAFEKRSDASAESRRRRMGPELLAEAAWLEEIFPAFGFGRVEVAPLVSEQPMAVIYYFMKTEWRFRPIPFDEKRYIRWWSSSLNIRGGTIKFAWVSSRPYRLELKDWTLRILGVEEHDHERVRELGEETFPKELRHALGISWYFQFMCWRAQGKPPVRPILTFPSPDPGLSPLVDFRSWSALQREKQNHDPV